MTAAIVEYAFSRLFPGTDLHFEAALHYSGRFKPYNATVRRLGSRLSFSLSKSWESTSSEIVVGLIQHLIVRILKKKGFSTLNMQLYEEFIRGVSDVAVVSASGDDQLASSFARVNERYFLGVMDRTNLRWGNGSFRKLASFDYHTNSITVSSLFKDASQHLLDYLMYHELLHKKLKFSSSNGRARHHGSEFRKLERQFEGSETIEGELSAFIRGSRRRFSGRGFSWRRMLSFQ